MPRYETNIELEVDLNELDRETCYSVVGCAAVDGIKVLEKDYPDINLKSHILATVVVNKDAMAKLVLNTELPVNTVRSIIKKSCPKDMIEQDIRTKWFILITGIWPGADSLNFNVFAQPKN